MFGDSQTRVLFDAVISFFQVPVSATSPKATLKARKQSFKQPKNNIPSVSAPRAAHRFTDPHLECHEITISDFNLYFTSPLIPSSAFLLPWSFRLCYYPTAFLESEVYTKFATSMDYIFMNGGQHAAAKDFTLQAYQQ